MQPRSATWRELTERYSTYRAMPVWGTMVRVPDIRGRLHPGDATAIAERGRRAWARVDRVIRRFDERCAGLWPATPDVLLADPALLGRLRDVARPGLSSLRNFWDAVVFDRDGYECRYCGRDAFEFLRHTGQLRTIWLVVDHLDAGKNVRGEFDPTNSVTACWTCNTIKGPLPEEAFLQELDLLVDARTQHRARPNARQPGHPRRRQ
jgi:5-methylcytosine-specific restriction endonuclease McrA